MRRWSVCITTYLKVCLKVCLAVAEDMHTGNAFKEEEFSSLSYRDGIPSRFSFQQCLTPVPHTSVQ